MRKNAIPARAPNKRTLVKLGAVLAAAMLGIGAFSLVDTATADGFEYEFGAWTDTSTTQTTSTEDAPEDPDGYSEQDSPYNKQQWVLQAGPTYPNPETDIQFYPGTRSEAPDAEAMTDNHGPDVIGVGDWTPVEGSGTAVYTEGGQILVGTYVYNMRGNPRLAPGQSPAADHPDWGRMGGFPSHAQGREPGDIYNVSNNNQGNASWFMIGGEFERAPDVYSHTLYEWQREITLRGEPVFTWVLQEREVTRIELPAYYFVPQNWRSNNNVGGTPDTPPGPNDPGWHNFQRDNARETLPEGREEGVPFREGNPNQGNAPWFRWVKVDGPAFRSGEIVPYVP